MWHILEIVQDRRQEVIYDLSNSGRQFRWPWVTFSHSPVACLLRWNFSCSCAEVDKISTDNVRCAVSLRQLSFLFRLVTICNISQQWCNHHGMASASPTDDSTIVIYRRMEGGRLVDCSKGAQPGLKAVYHSGCRDTQLLAVGFDRKPQSGMLLPVVETRTHQGIR